MLNILEAYLSQLNQGCHRDNDTIRHLIRAELISNRAALTSDLMLWNREVQRDGVRHFGIPKTVLTSLSLSSLM
jgi:hypothetical protein